MEGKNTEIYVIKSSDLFWKISCTKLIAVIILSRKTVRKSVNDSERKQRRRIVLHLRFFTDMHEPPLNLVLGSFKRCSLQFKNIFKLYMIVCSFTIDKILEQSHTPSSINILMITCHIPAAAAYEVYISQ